MKKIIISAFVLGSYAGLANDTGSELLAVNTYTQVNKIKGGLFGYKSVTSDTDTNGNSVTVCENPGTTRCRIQAFTINPGRDGLNPHELEEIDKLVTERLSIEKTKGDFVFNNDFLVVYDYIVEKNALSYTIYDRDSAKENGFTF